MTLKQKWDALGKIAPQIGAIAGLVAIATGVVAFVYWVLPHLELLGYTALALVSIIGFSVTTVRTDPPARYMYRLLLCWWGLLPPTCLGLIIRILRQPEEQRSGLSLFMVVFTIGGFVVVFLVQGLRRQVDADMRLAVLEKVVSDGWDVKLKGLWQDYVNGSVNKESENHRLLFRIHGPKEFTDLVRRTNVPPPEINQQPEGLPMSVTESTRPAEVNFGTRRTATLRLFEHRVDSFAFSWWAVATVPGPWNATSETGSVYLPDGRTGQAKLIDRTTDGETVKLALIGEAPFKKA
jgi:hypothetical protein